MTLLAHGAEPHAAVDAAALPAGPRSADELLSNWGWEPVTMALLAASAVLYAHGVRRLWRASGPGRGIRRWEAGAFAAGWATMLVALISPIHPWGRVLFSVHMTQHELLMLLAAPLLVLGKPLVAALHALPTRWARAAARAAGVAWWRGTWRTATHPFVAFCVQTAVLWAWHIPALFEACLYNEFVHWLQHAMFLGSAVLFWWAVAQGRGRAMGYGMAVLYLFSTAMHSGLLGVLLTFDDTVWYPAYARGAHRWGVGPVEDQQLAGLIMWIPAGTLYVLAGLMLFAAWLRETEDRVLRREARALLQVAPRPEGR